MSAAKQFDPTTIRINQSQGSIGRSTTPTATAFVHEKPSAGWTDLPLTIKLLILDHYISTALKWPHEQRAVRRRLGRLSEEEMEYNNYGKSMAEAEHMIMDVAKASPSLCPLIEEACAHRRVIAENSLAIAKADGKNVQILMNDDAITVVDRVF